MPIEITRTAIENLVRFKERLSSDPGKPAGETREYKVFLDVKTGEMNFAKKVSLDSVTPKNKPSLGEWKEVTILVTDNPDVARAVRIDAKGLEAQAARVVQEMESVLNRKVEEVQSRRPGLLLEEAALLNLSSILVSGEPIQKSPGWMGSISRKRADDLLEGQPKGTYVIRSKDEEVDLIIPELQKTNHKRSIEYFLLTYVDEEKTETQEEKTAERLILKTPEGWLVYNDEPKLGECPVFLNLETLIDSLELKSPFLRRS